MRPPFLRRFSHAAREDSDLHLRVLQGSEFVSVGLVDRLKGGSDEEGADTGLPTAEPEPQAETEPEPAAEEGIPPQVFSRFPF